MNVLYRVPTPTHETQVLLDRLDISVPLLNPEARIWDDFILICEIT